VRRTRKKRIDSKDEATMRRQKGRDKMIVIRNQRDRALIGSIVGTMPQRRWPGPEEPSNYYLFPFDASRPLGLSPRNAPITLLPRFLLAAREASKLLPSRDASDRVIACGEIRRSAGDRRSAIGDRRMPDEYGCILRDRDAARALARSLVARAVRRSETGQRRRFVPHKAFPRRRTPTAGHLIPEKATPTIRPTRAMPASGIQRVSLKSPRDSREERQRTSERPPFVPSARLLQIV